MPVHDFDPPDRFVVGTVGPPGQRVFFLQALRGRRLVSVSCEKEQVAILAERVDDVLDQYAGAAAVAGPEDNDPLATPIEDEFRVATLSLAWDPSRAVIVIEAYDADLPEDEAEEPEETEGPGRAAPEGVTDPLGVEEDRSLVRVVLSPPQARSFVRRARALVGDPRLLVLDEPTAAMPAGQRIQALTHGRPPVGR